MILRKTEAGVRALQGQEAGVKLPARLRTLLLQIDGNKSSDELVRLALSLGSQPEALDKLIELGLAEMVAQAPAAVPPAPPAPVRAPAPAPVAMPPADETDEDDDLPVVPVSNSLPIELQPVAAQMRTLADQHLGLGALLLKRRISRCDSEQELRVALVALNEALAKATNPARATELLADVTSILPIIGLNRPQAYRG